MGAPELSGPPGYSPTALDHIRAPRNVGRLADANGFGEVDDPTTENYISVYLLVQAGQVAAARFRTLGCSACVAASSALTELAIGRSLAEVAAIDAAEILRALDGLPEAKHHCAELAAQALAAALADYHGRQ